MKPPLTLLLAAPRGFCAGVDRAIQMVERALEKFGAPVYVRHQIVHNNFVVARLSAMGAIFVKELDEIPDGPWPVIVSAHGVPKSVPAAASERQLNYFDATCPLVSKVHREAERHYANGLHLILVGHAGHPEVVGTMGQLPPGAVTLIETREDVAALELPSPDKVAYVTQTTLSVDDTAAIVADLQTKFPNIVGPLKEDICYATTNRQASVKAVAEAGAEALLVIGAPSSSNSNRLVEVGQQHGITQAWLIERASDIQWNALHGIKRLGLSAGASAPDVLIDEVIASLGQRYTLTIQEVRVTTENTVFKLPRQLSERVA